jgi:hypothetical protein
MYHQLKITSMAFIVALVPFLFLSSPAIGIEDADSCKGSNCSTEGQFCRQGALGASDASYICDNKKWVELLPRPCRDDEDYCLPGDHMAASCKGWECNTEGQVCPQGVPGASTASYICDNKKWVELIPPKPMETAHCKWQRWKGTYGPNCKENGLFCPQGVPGAPEHSYVCTNFKWVEETGTARDLREQLGMHRFPGKATRIVERCKIQANNGLRLIYKVGTMAYRQS